MLFGFREALSVLEDIEHGATGPGRVSGGLPGRGKTVCAREYAVERIGLPQSDGTLDAQGDAFGSVPGTQRKRTAHHRPGAADCHRESGKKASNDPCG